MLKYIKLAKIAIVQVLSFVEDEHCFITLISMKRNLRNWLTTHLNVVIWTFAQKFYIIWSFLYDQVIEKWKVTHNHYVIDV
jgi:hypothetical protein